MSSLTLYHHPFSRAASTVGVLEEVGQPYDLVLVDIMKGAQKHPDFLKTNAMGKLPVLRDGDSFISESSAIAMYLADRYALGRLSPALDSPLRGPYLRWCVFPAVVIEPAAIANMNKWTVDPGQAGWGSYDVMIEAVRRALEPGPWLLGDTFSMADVLMGGTLGYMLDFKLIDPRPELVAYVERFRARPAIRAAEAKNEAVRKELGL